MFKSYLEARNHYLSLSPEEREHTDFTTTTIWGVAGIPKIYQFLDIEKDWEGDSVAKELVLEYLENLDENIKNGIGIHFYGGYGTGKTFLATYLLREAIRSFDYRLPPLYYGCFYPFSELVRMFSELQSQIREVLFEKLKRIDLLVIDDVGREIRERGNIYQVTLDSLLRQRIYEKKPLFVTTNKSPEELASEYGEGTLSLICEGMIRINVLGEDYRKKLGRKK